MRTQANIATPMVRLVRLVDDCEETWRNREIFANSIQQTLDVWLNHFGSELGGQRVVFTWSTWNVPISKRSGALRKVHRRFLTRWENRSISQDTPTHTRSVNFSSWTFIFSHAERTHDCGKEPRRGPSCGPSCGLVFLTLLWTLPDVTNLQSALWFVLCLIACGWIQNASRSHKITSEQCWNIGELTHPSVCVCLISAFNGWTCSTDGHSMILRRMQNSWFLFLLMLWQMLNTGVQLLKPLPPKDTFTEPASVHFPGHFSDHSGVSFMYSVQYQRTSWLMLFILLVFIFELLLTIDLCMIATQWNQLVRPTS